VVNTELRFDLIGTDGITPAARTAGASFDALGRNGEQLSRNMAEAAAAMRGTGESIERAGHDATETAAQFQSLALAARELDGQDVHIDVEVDGAVQAAVQLAELDAEAAAVDTTTRNAGGSGGGTFSFARALGDFGRAAESATKFFPPLATAAIAIAPAIVPIGAAALSAGAGLVSMATLGGAAAAAFGAAAVLGFGAATANAGLFAEAQKGVADAQQRVNATTPGTKAHTDALKQLAGAQKDLAQASKDYTPLQRELNKSLADFQATLGRVTTDTSKFTLAPMTTAINAASAAIPKLTPIVASLAPIAQQVANAFNMWVTAGGGLNRAVSYIDTYGVGIIGNFVETCRSLLAVGGDLLRTFAPSALRLSESIATLAGKARLWADNGGFERFLRYVTDNGPKMRELLDAVGGALKTVGEAAKNMSGLSFNIVLDFFKVVAALNPRLVSDLATAYLALSVSLRAVSAVQGLAGVAAGMGAVGAARTPTSAPATGAAEGAGYAAAGASAGAAFRSGFMRGISAAGTGLTIAIVGNQLASGHGAAGEWGKVGADAAGGFAAGFMAAGPIGGLVGGLSGAIVGAVSSPTVMSQIKTTFSKAADGLGAAVEGAVTGHLPPIKSKVDHLWDGQPAAIDYNINNPIKKGAEAARRQLIEDTVKDYAKFPGAINYNIGAPSEKVALAARKQLIDDTAKAYDKFPGAIDFNIRNPLAKGALEAREAFIKHLSEAFGVAPDLIKRSIEQPDTAAAKQLLIEFQGRAGHLFDNTPASVNSMVLAPGVGAAANIQSQFAAVSSNLYSNAPGSLNQYVIAPGSFANGKIASDFAATSANLYNNVPSATQLMVLQPGVSAASQIASQFAAVSTNAYNNAPGALNNNVIQPANSYLGGPLPQNIQAGIGKGFSSAASNVVNPFLSAASRAVSGLGAASIPMMVFASPGAANPALASPFAAHADGGLLGGAGTGRSDSNLIWAGAGEFIVNAESTAQWLPVLQSINKGVKGFADGGPVGPIMDNGQAAPTWEKYFDSQINPALKNLEARYAMEGSVSSGAVLAQEKVVDEWLKKKDAAYLAAIAAAFAAGGGGAPSAQVAAWISAAMQAAGVSGAAWATGMAVLIARESGGNPNAVNNSDSNAAAGHPSQGLTQVIPSTFAAYHVPGTSTNILDPVANIAASIRYIQATYGDISRVQQANPNLPPAGYAAGGLITEQIWGIGKSGRRYTFGENGYETVTPGYDHWKRRDGESGGVWGMLEVVHKTPDGRVMERELVQLKRRRGGSKFEWEHN